MSETQQVMHLSVPDDWTSFEREEFAQQVVDFIKARTDDGKDINNQSFAGYSDSYASSLDFRIAGKSKSNVNLRLSGEMMDTVDLISHTAGTIFLGFQSGTDANDKAAWAAASDNGPSRKFLGLDDASLNRLVSQFETSAGIDARRQGSQAESSGFSAAAILSRRVLLAAFRRIAVRAP